jgi:hypothetical protein
MFKVQVGGIDKDTYFKMNKRVSKLADKLNIEYRQMYGHFGPRVRRCKLWGTTHRTAGLSVIKAFCHAVARLPHVKRVQADMLKPHQNGNGYFFVPSIRVYYK